MEAAAALASRANRLRAAALAASGLPAIPASGDTGAAASSCASKAASRARKRWVWGAGAVFSFDCAGGRTGGQDLIRGMTLWSHLANVGDAKSLVIHPASTTHRQLSDDELRAAGVGPGTVRLSVGTESVADLIWDLEQGFALVAATAGKKVATA